MLDTEKNPFVSPRIATLRESLATGDRTALDTFWQEVAEHGSPLIELLEGEGSSRLVTFLWRDPGETRNVVMVHGPASWGDWRGNLFVHLPESDLWYRTYRLRSDLRTGYWLSPNDPLIPLREIKDMGAHWSRYQLDPLNPRTSTYPKDDETPGDKDVSFSLLELPDMPAQSWITPRSDVAQGRVEMFRKHVHVSVDVETYRNSSRCSWQFPGPPCTFLAIPLESHLERKDKLLSERWLHDYTVLALRLNKAVWQSTSYQPVEEYQPPEWDGQVLHEPVHPADLLLRDAQQLQETLPLQQFEPQRTAYLTRQLGALETVSRRLLGEHFSLQEQARRCYDLDIDWLPESIFEQAYTLYDEALPGHGSIASRLHHWQESLTLPPEKAYMLPSFFQRALTEALLRTKALIPLPADTYTEIQDLVDRPIWAMARYLGNHRSRVYLNSAVPFPLSDLFYVLCHEGYPGHLAEFVLKDEILIQQRGYLEERVLLPCSPRYVISEGLALLSHEMIFAPMEAEAWLAEHIYREAGIRSDHSDLTKIHRARDLLFGVSCNAAWLLGEGHPQAEVLDYLMRYALLSEEVAHRELASLQRPFYEANIFTYFYGRRLLEPLLQGPQRKARLRQFLTEQTAPSDL